FLPYHLFRGIQHLFLAAYYMVPLCVLLALWLYLDRDFVFYPDPVTSRPHLRLAQGRSIAAVLICLIVASTGIYYASFACYLFLLGGMAAALTRRRWYPVITAAFLVGIVAVGLAANMLPTVVYRFRYGENPAAVVRNPADAEGGALKVAQLLLPVTGHRL